MIFCDSYNCVLIVWRRLSIIIVWSSNERITRRGSFFVLKFYSLARPCRYRVLMKIWVYQYYDSKKGSGSFLPLSTPLCSERGPNAQTEAHARQPGDGNVAKVQHMHVQVIKPSVVHVNIFKITWPEVDPPRVRLLGAHDQHQQRLPKVTTIRLLAVEYLRGGGGGGRQGFEKRV
jgi:hypothetical protein